MNVLFGIVVDLCEFAETLWGFQWKFAVDDSLTELSIVLFIFSLKPFKSAVLFRGEKKIISCISDKKMSIPHCSLVNTHLKMAYARMLYAAYVLFHTCLPDVYMKAGHNLGMCAFQKSAWGFLH